MPAEEKPSAQIRLERLLYANLSLATEMSVDRVLQKVTDVAVELIGCRYAALGVLGADGRALESFTTTGITAEHRQQIGALPRGHGILGLVIREATVVRLPDLRKTPGFLRVPAESPAHALLPGGADHRSARGLRQPLHDGKLAAAPSPTRMNT